MAIPTQEFLENRDYMRAILGVFLLQHDRQSTIINIAAATFDIRREDVHGGKEHVRIFNAIKDLRKDGILTLVKPLKKRGFRQHYILNEDAFLKALFNAIKSLPSYGPDWGPLFSAKHVKDKDVRYLWLMYYRGLAYQLLTVPQREDPQWDRFVNDLNIRTSFGLLLDRFNMIPRDEGELMDRGDSLFENMIRGIELCADYYLPLSRIRVVLQDMRAFIKAVRANKAKYPDVYDYVPGV